MANEDFKSDTMADLERRAASINSMIKIINTQISLIKVQQEQAVQPETRQTLAQSIEKLQDDITINRETINAIQKEIKRRNNITELQKT